jgi:hypothetical protein
MGKILTQSLSDRPRLSAGGEVLSHSGVSASNRHLSTSEITAMDFGWMILDARHWKTFI